jgi:hypothetical protein
LLSAGLFAVATSAYAPAAAFAAETWMSCEGSVVTTGTGPDGKPLNDTQPSKQVLAYDDGAQRLFRYSETSKKLSPMPVKSYGPDAITWAGSISASGFPSWEGKLDRAKMSVSVVRTENGNVMTWTEQCKPTQPPR